MTLVLVKDLIGRVIRKGDITKQFGLDKYVFQYMTRLVLVHLRI